MLFPRKQLEKCDAKSVDARDLKAKGILRESNGRKEEPKTKTAEKREEGVQESLVLPPKRKSEESASLFSCDLISLSPVVSVPLESGSFAVDILFPLLFPLLFPILSLILHTYFLHY
jgi:hypothetical protein